MIKQSGIALIACVSALSVSSSAQALSVQPGTFTAETTILDLGLGDLDLLTVTARQTGVANSSSDPDIALAQAAANLDLGLFDANLDLGILGVEWLDGNTFELIFDLDANLDVAVLNVPLGLTATPTIDWLLKDLAFDDRVIDVVQVGGDGFLADNKLAFDQTSIGITFDNLIGAELSLFGTGERRATFDVVGMNDVAPVPLPAGAWLLGGALGGLVAWRRKTRKV